jgi:glycosyltransferase involved in cell wall biosynthesis
MATAVLDLDLTNLPSTIPGLHQYTKALVLVRYKGKPIGQKIFPVTKGVLQIEENINALLNIPASTLLLHDYLGWDERRVTNFTAPTATVAVCTRDRPEDLKRCLDALMRLPDDGQEFLVIDNCPSTDQTRTLVESYGRIRYVREERAGLNIARNRALQEARHEIVAFTDDDAVPDTNWLRALIVNFNNALVVCVTGLTMPLELETEAQEAFEKYSPFGKGFKRVIHARNWHNPLATGQVGAGANMALRRSIQKDVGFFDEALDAGTPTHSGGDHEMFARILIAGYQIVYDPSALSWHRHRRTWKELQKTIYGYGVGVYSLFTRHLVTNGEWSVLKIGFQWFWYGQLRSLLRSVLKRPGHMPLALILAELRGCMVGPWAYVYSCLLIKKKTSSRNHYE